MTPVVADAWVLLVSWTWSEFLQFLSFVGMHIKFLRMLLCVSLLHKAKIHGKPGISLKKKHRNSFWTWKWFHAPAPLCHPHEGAKEKFIWKTKPGITTLAACVTGWMKQNTVQGCLWIHPLIIRIHVQIQVTRSIGVKGWCDPWTRHRGAALLLRKQCHIRFILRFLPVLCSLFLQPSALTFRC